MKLTSQNFDKNTGISVVQVQHKGYKARGIAKVHPNDIEYMSRYAGCRIAELRAFIKIYKQEIREIKIQLETINAFKKDLLYSNIDIPSKIKRKINLCIRNYSQKIESLQEEIISINNLIKKDIKDRDKIIKRFNNKKKDKEK